MKLLEIFRFELAYQARRGSTWLYVAVLLLFAFAQTVGGFLPRARSGGYFLNAPLVIANVTVVLNVVWTLVAAYLAGELATRDAETGMHPLTHTVPAGKTAHLGGRFLAAFTLNAALLLVVPAGMLLGLYAPEVEAEVRGPLMPMAYLTAYALIALPTAFVVCAVQFAFAALSRRAIAGYVASLGLMAVAGSASVVVDDLGFRELGKLLDPIGFSLVAELSTLWTATQKNTLLVGLDGAWLLNRVVWLGIGVAVLAFTQHRFRLRHPAERASWRRRARRGDSRPTRPEGDRSGIAPISMPRVARSFGVRTRVRQTLAIAWTSFVHISKSWGGLISYAVVALIALGSASPGSFMGVPYVPRTDRVIAGLVAFGAPPIYFMIPLIIVFWSAALVWREREAGLGEIVDATPVPDWTLIVGKLLGLALGLAACLTLRLGAGLFAQVTAGYPDIEIVPYLQVLFGIQLGEYMVLAVLVVVIYVVVNQKQVGHVAAILSFLMIVALRGNGIGHVLLVYGYHPDWAFTDMRGFGASLGPWLWFQLYWSAWAVLLVVAGRMLWVRGREEGFGVRLRIARRRLTSRTASVAVAAVALVLATGGFIFYNTDVLAERREPTDGTERRAEYERRFGGYADAAQPRLTGTDLRVEIHPRRGEVEVRGTYRLENATLVAIDTVLVATAQGAVTGAIDFDRPADLVARDDDLEQRIYALPEPLQPGDSLSIGFAVRVGPGSFIRGTVAPVVPNGTWFKNDWLPAVGYRPARELQNPGDRRAHGLPVRPAVPPLESAEQRVRAHDALHGEARAGAGRSIAFEAVVGTDAGQTAIAPGELRRTWTEDGRRYFHYAGVAPFGDDYAFFSADYEVREDRWNDVLIQIFHARGHERNVDRMTRSVQASLELYTELFGPYPFSHVRVVERAGHGGGMHADANTIDYQEATSLLDPGDGPLGIDLPFYVMAHEVAHQWWGAQVAPLWAEGAGLLIESLASYSAYQVVDATYGPEHLRRILGQLRGAYRIPSARGAVPLLRGTDSYVHYRKGPFAMRTLSEYVGREAVNGALRRMLEGHLAGSPSLLTTLDLHRELREVTPDSLRYLLHDLFEANTFWELSTEGATAERTGPEAWLVSLDVRARKVVVDTAGVETEAPMDDEVQIAVFGPAEEGEGEPIYLEMHRIRSGGQTITLTVPVEPDRAGIDPYFLLIDVDGGDNVIELEKPGGAR